jgi:hypothetical protein
VEVIHFRVGKDRQHRTLLWWGALVGRLKLIPPCRNTRRSLRAPSLCFRSRCRKMCFPQFIHKFCAHCRPASFQRASPAVQRSGGQILVSPCCHFQQKRNQCDASLRQAVYRFLFMGRVIGPGNDPLLDEPSQSVGQDIRCDAFHRLGQEFAEMPSINKNDVPDDEQSPLIAKHFDCLVDDAFRPVIRAHAAPRVRLDTPAFILRLPYYQLRCTTSCVIPPLSNSGGPEYAPTLLFQSS